MCIFFTSDRHTVWSVFGLRDWTQRLILFTHRGIISLTKSSVKSSGFPSRVISVFFVIFPLKIDKISEISCGVRSDGVPHQK